MVSAAESTVAQAFDPLIDAVAELGREDFSGSVARALSDVFRQNMEARDLQEALTELPEEERRRLETEFGAMLEGEAGRLHDAARKR